MSSMRPQRSYANHIGSGFAEAEGLSRGNGDLVQARP